MARVDFYVLSQSGEQARAVFACKLTEKAYRLGNTVHIQVDDAAAMQKVDELLWTFRDGSFIPHHCIGQGDLESPVTIGFGDEAPQSQLLINLSEHVPALAGSFERIAELVTADEAAKQLSRQRFTLYRDQGHDLETHKL